MGKYRNWCLNTFDVNKYNPDINIENVNISVLSWGETKYANTTESFVSVDSLKFSCYEWKPTVATILGSSNSGSWIRDSHSVVAKNI